MWQHASLIRHLQQGLIVSCQPVPGSPMDTPEIIAAMACASLAGGACGVRIEGVEALKAVRPMTDAPIIGIIKRDLPDSAVRITPWLQDIDDLCAAGADIIAFDATDRPRPFPVAELYQRARDHHRLTMADCATLEQGLAASQLGVDFIGTTLSGYTEGTPPDGPDLALVFALAEHRVRIIAEGRYHSPALAAAAMQAGAYAITVGSAVTRIEHICDWFHQAIDQAQPQEKIS